ncbi:phosphotransferase [bacterium]|nr:phosphotransferase [bacterium]
MDMRRVTEHLSSPLLRNGYALAVNTMGTAGIGALYWLVAARMYSAEDVGVNAALISAMMFLAKMAQLNLSNALNRFVPGAGPATRRLVLGSYAFAASMSGIAAVVFILGLSWWAPDLSVIESSTGLVVGFVLATMAWSVFVLQDAALTGLRRSTWVPIENLIFGLAKIALLIVFVAIAPRIGIFASWTVPLFALLLVVNRLLFRRAVPAHVEATRHRPHTFDAGVIARFAAADFMASLGWMATIDLLPVVVIALVGAEANAYFFLAWTIAYTLFLVSRSTGMSLIAEAALDPAKLRSYSRKVLVQTSWLIVPLAAGLFLFAPLILGVFGADYSREGTTVLRLLVASALPNIVISLYASVARVERRLLAMGVMYGILGTMVLTLSIVLTGPLGIAGVGWAWLVSTTTIAAVLLVTEMRLVWLPQFLDSSAGTFTLRLAKAILGSRLTEAPMDDRLEAAIDRVRQDHGHLEVVGRPATELDLAAVTVGPSPAESTAILKLAKTPTASESLLGEADALEAVARNSRLDGWPVAIPRLLVCGDVDGLVYTAQSHLDGVDGRTATELGLDLDLVMVRAARVASGLHHRTSQETELTPAEMVKLVDDPIGVLARTGGVPLPRRHAGSLDRLRDRRYADLADRTVTTSWVHGDFWLGNLLIGGGAEVSGVVDWGGLDRSSLPDLDMAHLILTTRSLRRSTELGTVVADALDMPDWTEAEGNVLAMIAGRDPRDSISWRSLVLLTWIHHVASNLRKSERYRGKWLWTTRNVHHVLEVV